MPQRPTKLVVEPLPTGVGCDLGSQAGQKTSQRLGPVALQGEEVFQLVYDALDELALARRPATVGLRPSSLGIILGRGGDQSSVAL